MAAGFHHQSHGRQPERQQEQHEQHEQQRRQLSEQVTSGGRERSSLDDLRSGSEVEENVQQEEEEEEEEANQEDEGERTSMSGPAEEEDHHPRPSSSATPSPEPVAGSAPELVPEQPTNNEVGEEQGEEEDDDEGEEEEAAEEAVSGWKFTTCRSFQSGWSLRQVRARKRLDAMLGCGHTKVLLHELRESIATERVALGGSRLTAQDPFRLLYSSLADAARCGHTSALEFAVQHLTNAIDKDVTRDALRWTVLLEAAIEGGHTWFVRWLQTRAERSTRWKRIVSAGLDTEYKVGALTAAARGGSGRGALAWVEHFAALVPAAPDRTTHATHPQSLQSTSRVMSTPRMSSGPRLSSSTASAHVPATAGASATTPTTTATTRGAGDASDGQTPADGAEVWNSLLDDAAAGGSIAVYEYLESMGATATRSAIDHAARRGHLHMVRFLHHHRHADASTAAMDCACEYGHLRIVQFLNEKRKEKCTVWAMDSAAANGHLAVVEYLHFHCRDPPAMCTHLALENATVHGHFGVVKFLCEHRAEGDKELALDSALEHEYYDIAAYLLRLLHAEACMLEAEDPPSLGEFWMHQSPDVVEFMARHAPKAEWDAVVAAVPNKRVRRNMRAVRRTQRGTKPVKTTILPHVREADREDQPIFRSVFPMLPSSS